MLSIATVVGLMITDAVIRNGDETILPNLKLEDFKTIVDEASLGEDDRITIVHESDSVSLRNEGPREEMKKKLKNIVTTQHF